MKQHSMVAEFKNSLKNPCAEELIDLFFYRPLAFIFVKSTMALPLTPNRVSVLAMVAGIAAGISLAGGAGKHFLLGGLLFGLSNVLDCADGMIARLKKNGTKTGRIVDGIVDYVASGAVYLGFGIGLTKATQCGDVHLPCNAWLLVVLAVVSTILHSISSDYFRNAFVRRLAGKTTIDDDDHRIFSEEMVRLRQYKGHYIDKILIMIYLRYLTLQTGKSRPAAHAQPPMVSAKAVVSWNLIGPSTHITFFIGAALLYRPAVFFFFTIVLANLWMIGLFLLQAVQKRNLHHLT